MGITFIDGNLLIWLQEKLNAEWLTPVMKAVTLFGEAGVFWIAVCTLLIVFRRTRRLGIICALSLAFSFLCCNIVIKPLVDRARPWELFEEVIHMLPDPGDASFPSGHTTNAIAPAWAMFLASTPAFSGRRRDGQNGEDGLKVQNGEEGLKVQSGEDGPNGQNGEDGPNGQEVRKASYKDVPCLGWNGTGADPRIVHRFAVCAVILSALIGLSRLYLGMHYPTDVLCGFLLGMICATAVFSLIRRRESRTGLIGSRM